MFYIKSVKAIVIAVASCILISGCHAVDYKEHTSFVNPENIYRPSVRYWLPDASISAEVLRNDIEDLARVGIGGLEFVPFYMYGLPSGGTPPTNWDTYGYGTLAYKQVFDAALKASEEQQLLMSFALGANQGQGSPAKMESKGLAKELAYSSIVVPSGSNFSGELPLPVSHAPSEASIASFMHKTVDRIEQKLVAVIAGRIEQVLESSYLIVFQNISVPVNNTYLEESSLVDITSSVVEGELSFQPLGSGDWQIMAFYERYTNQKSCTGAPNPDTIIANGSWIVDHFSDVGAKVTTDFIDQNVLDSNNQKALNKIGQYVWEDSMEMIATAWWTPDFLTEFEARRNYSLSKYLPFIYNGENFWGQLIPTYLNRTYLGNGTDGGKSVNDDYRTTLTELHERYIDHMQDWSHRRGLKFSNQPAYNLPLDMAAIIPLIDTPETESLGFFTLDQLRQFTGPAHISNKKVISSETGAVVRGTSAYSQTMPDLLAKINLQLASGVNEFVLHGTPYSGEYAGTTWPGYTPFFYVVTDMHSKAQPAWNTYKPSMDYIARNSLISQIGTSRIDIAFLTTAEAYKLQVFDTSSITSAGYSYEYIAPLNLNLKSSTISNRILAPYGPAFKALVIDGMSSIPYDTVSRLEDYVKQGFPIIFLKSVPSNITGICLPPSCDAKKFQSRLNKLVAENPTTVGISASIDAIPQFLSTLKINPRVTFTGGSWFYTMWKSVLDSSAEYIYFWNPDRAAKASFSVEFSETRYPSKVDAWTGAYNPVVEYKRTGNKISMALNLNGNESTILAFFTDQRFYGQQYSGVSVVESDKNVLAFESKNHGITAHVIGDSSITLSNAKVVQIYAKVPDPFTLRAWNITIEDWQPTSNFLSMDTQIVKHTILNTTLKPWTEYQLPNTSGIGHYTTDFNLVSPNAKLALGTIQHTVKAFLNGHELPPINIFDPTIDISAYSRIGINLLQIDVSTTLFNAVKSRGSIIKTADVPASLSNPLLSENATSVDYGLLGPVVVTPYKPMKVV